MSKKNRSICHLVSIETVHRMYDETGGFCHFFFFVLFFVSTFVRRGQTIVGNTVNINCRYLQTHDLIPARFAAMEKFRGVIVIWLVI